MRLGLVTGYSGPKMQHTMEVILICISRVGRQKRKMPCLMSWLMPSPWSVPKNALPSNSHAGRRRPLRP